MYFEIEDYRPDISPVGRAISWREGVLISIIFHLCFVIFILLFPRMFPSLFREDVRARVVQQQEAKRDQPRFVFVAPRNDIAALKPPPRAEASDKDRVARAPEKALKPTNPLPFSRGNSPERTEAPPAAPPEQARGQGPTPEPAQGQQAQAELQVPESQSKMQFNTSKPQAQNNAGAAGRSPGGGSLGDALRNLDRVLDGQQFNNPGGAGGADVGGLQFDTKGVEFGPWIRRFIAQVKRNWLFPYNAMSNHGHVVITFIVHKSGSITDINVVGPSPIGPFNNAAFGALSSSNPTVPLPAEYPDSKMVITGTFYYNETPPQ